MEPNEDFKSQLQAIRPRDQNDRVREGEEMNEERKSARSKADFMRLVGIGPELADFVIAFLEKPEILFSMPFEMRHEFENQMDVILSSFEQ